jgi:SecD/SecF fusion protein
MPWHVNPLFAQAAAQDRGSIPWYIGLLVAVATIAASFFLGGYLGRKLRMPDHGWKIGICLFSLLASAVVVLMGPPLKLGIDLSGGAILVYEVDQATKKPGEVVDMDKLVAAVTRRVNPGGQKEVVVRRYGVEQIEIIIPEKEEAEVERIERIISRTGNLEFRILANNRNDKELIERAMAEPNKMQIFDSAGNLLAWWVPVKEGQERSFAGYSEIAHRTRKVKGGSREVLEILVENDIYNVTGGYLTQAAPGTDRQGRPCVNFTFNSTGGQLFGELTGSHLPDKLTDFTYKLGIILDGELYSAPSIQSTIFDHGEISGDFSKEQVQDLVNVLNAGSLPAALTKEPISKLYSGPTLGNDTIRKSTDAMIISSILVPLFMLWYYRFSGLVANIALFLNMLMLFAVMLTIKAAFTLTGFAGLALTVGMAVDNNVLVYERLREELERGATVRMAIRNAFHRAGATIVDCNLTHMIAATVLYMIGSDQVKGFAVTLWLGVATSMYTSVFVARVIFDIAEKRQWITKVKMLRVIGHTNIDFMGWFRYCLVGSILVTVMAIVVAFYRGTGLFDIDFTGGISVQALFDQPQDPAMVRAKLTDRLPDVAVSDVHLGGEPQGLRFDIDTSESDMDKVKRVLSEAFGDKLARNTVTFSKPALVEATGRGPGEAAPPKPAEAPKKSQSRRDLPQHSLLAMAGGNSLSVALADAPQKSAPAKPKGTGETPVAPAKGTGGTPVAPAKPPVAEKLTPAQPVEVPRPKTAPRKPLPAETQPKARGGAAERPAAGPDPYAGGSQSRLTFKVALNQLAVKQLIISAIEANKLAPEAVPFQVSRPDFVEGDNAKYKQWDLKVLLPPAKAEPLLSTLRKHIADNPIFPASNTIGGAVAGSTRVHAVYALVASWACIIIYLWVRFQGVAFGVAAVVALIHDVFVMLGAVAISIYIAPFLGFLLVEPIKVNLPIVAAFLTIIGYSVNDTIVVFDRIREVRGKDPNLTRKMVNDSTNQTLSRTLLTSFTVFLVVVVLYLFGGEAVHGFAFALLVGVATGTYSSIYVAAPILLWLVGKHRESAAA